MGGSTLDTQTGQIVKRRAQDLPDLMLEQVGGIRKLPSQPKIGIARAWVIRCLRRLVNAHPKGRNTLINVPSDFACQIHYEIGRASVRHTRSPSGPISLSIFAISSLALDLEPQSWYEPYQVLATPALHQCPPTPPHKRPGYVAIDADTYNIRQRERILPRGMPACCPSRGLGHSLQAIATASHESRMKKIASQLQILKETFCHARFCHCAGPFRTPDTRIQA